MLQDSSKRRRTKKQIAAEKLAKEQHEANIQAQLAELAEAKAKLVDYEQLKVRNSQAETLLQQLHARGDIEIDEHGTATPSKRRPGGRGDTQNSEFQDFDQQ